MVDRGRTKKNKGERGFVSESRGREWPRKRHKREEEGGGKKRGRR